MAGRVLLAEAGLLVLPLAVSLLYREDCAWAVLASMAVAAVLGGLLTLLARPRSHKFFSREGYIIVALAWVLLSAVGALPFWFSREIPSYADAFFETVSGFTTTGASILTDVEAMSHGLLFWRSFTHWVGGMGVLVFITMLSGSTDRSMNILKAEMPGPVKGQADPPDPGHRPGAVPAVFFLSRRCWWACCCWGVCPCLTAWSTPSAPWAPAASASRPTPLPPTPRIFRRSSPFS